MKSLRVYLAASFSSKRDAVLRASTLRSLGITVTSSWLLATNDTDPLDDPEICEAAALSCHRDVEHSDVLLLIAPPFVSCGKYVELGIALALTKRVVIVGAPPTVFRNHPFVAARFDNPDIDIVWEEALSWLREQLHE